MRSVATGGLHWVLGKEFTLSYHNLVAEWIHFTLFWIVLPTIKLKVYTFLGLMNSATKITRKTSYLL